MDEIKYKALIYIRLSNADKNSFESESIANQRKIINEFLAKHPEIENVGEKIDDGYSGILFDRPAFVEMMSEIEQGTINCIVTRDLSRLGREHIEVGRYLRRIFPTLGVRFIAIGDNFDTLSDSADDLSILMRIAMNDAYAYDISKKTRASLESKRKNGDYIGACPIYGYKKDENNRNSLVADEYPANIVMDIFRMKIEGISAARIAAILNERGVLSPIAYKKYNRLPHPKGSFSDSCDAKWSVTTILRTLRNETYTGALIQGKTGTPNFKLKESLVKSESEWHRIEDTHEAIVPKSIFDLVQKMLKSDTRTSPNENNVYPLSGILICGNCGNRMTRKTVPSRTKNIHYRYYYCPTGSKKGCDLGVSIRENDLHFCVLYSIKAHISNLTDIERVLATSGICKYEMPLIKKLELQVSENEKRLSKIHSFASGLYESMVNGDLTKSEYKSLKSIYSNDAKLLSEANMKLQREIEDILHCRHENTELMQRLKDFENIEILNRRTVMCFIHSIHIHDKYNIEISYNHQSVAGANSRRQT